MGDRADPRDAPSLLAKTVAQALRLLSNEAALLRAELAQAVSRAGIGLALIGAGAILALSALNVLAAALVAALAQSGLGAGGAALLVGAALLAIAVGLAVAGRRRLKADALAPKRTARNLRADLETVKEHTHV